MRVKGLILPSIAVLALAAAPQASAAGGGAAVGAKKGRHAPASHPKATGSSGGVGLGRPASAPSGPTHPTVPGFAGKIVDGLAYAPSYAPIQVQQAIWAGDRIRKKPYIWGGGHGSFKAAGYDCSGAVSYVLHAAGLLKTPYASGDFMAWGEKGIGRWITVYANPGHAFIEIAGIRLDTSAESDPNPAPGSGPRWRPVYPDPPGFRARHPLGY
ncbi:MAG: C40 family peptidase [Actinomycetota bacterium]|nr:C40 family peptidase [Actinomycetota bacterium]